MNSNEVKKEMASRGFYVNYETEEFVTYYKPSTGEIVTYPK